MRKTILKAALLSVAAAFALPALAQTGADAQAQRDDVAKVRIDGGVIMVSDGGPFVSAMQEQRVAAGDRVMVSNDSIVTLVYDDGCEQKYDEPGVYKVEPECKRAIAWWGGDRWKAVAIGAAIVGGIVLINEINDDDDDKPISR